jgi:hypothetical protein
VPSLIKTYGGGSRDVEISFAKARKSSAAQQEDGLDYREVIGSTSGAVKHLIRHIGDMYSREINSVTYKRRRAAGLDQSPSRCRRSLLPESVKLNLRNYTDLATGPSEEPSIDSVRRTTDIINYALMRYKKVSLIERVVSSKSSARECRINMCLNIVQRAFLTNKRAILVISQWKSKWAGSDYEEKAITIMIRPNFAFLSFNPLAIRMPLRPKSRAIGRFGLTSTCKY